MEDECLFKGIEGGVHDASGQVGDFAGAEDAVFIADPLLGAARDDVDDFLAVRMAVEGVTVAGRHGGADHEELFRGDEIGAAQPFIVGPRVGLVDLLAVLDEALG